jgi:hypothetical protein
MARYSRFVLCGPLHIYVPFSGISASAFASCQMRSSPDPRSIRASVGRQRSPGPPTRTYTFSANPTAVPLCPCRSRIPREQLRRHVEIPPYTQIVQRIRALRIASVARVDCWARAPTYFVTSSDVDGRRMVCKLVGSHGKLVVCRIGCFQTAISSDGKRLLGGASPFNSRSHVRAAWCA